MDDLPLAKLLHRWRLASGLSQEALAERSGLSVNGIAQIETGKRTAPRASTLRMLADALDLDAERRQALAIAARRGEPPAPEAASGSRAPAQARMPIPHTPLVGRAGELAEALRLLRDGDLPVVTLTGPGGVGKTRLALAVAGAWAAEQPDAPIWVELASLADPDLVPSAVARAAGVPESPGRPVIDSLTSALSDRPRLLVLDNCEHLLPRAAEVAAQLLERCPALRVLATSRSPLHIRRECLFPVPTLALPDPDALPPPAKLVAIDAVALFTQRARAARPDFVVTEGNAASIADICCRLDGLPLALELAAARMRVLSPAALQGLLEERLRLLVGGPTDTLARLRTLRAAIEWSHDLLTSRQQRIFRRLGVFAGGCTLDAAAAVAGDDPITVLEGVEALIDQSLLTRREQQDGEVRLGMLETFRAFALEQLAAHDETVDARSRHATWVLALAESLGAMIDGPRHALAMLRLEAEHPNLLHALAWLEERGDAERMQRLGGALMPYWNAAGAIVEANGWLERALALDGATGASRASALVAAGQAAVLAGDFDRARSRLGDGIAMATTHGAWEAEVRGLYWLGCAALFRGNLDEALAHSTACLTLAREHGDHTNAGAALWSLGFVAMGEGDHALARRRLAESLSLAREAGSPPLIAFVQCELANLDYRQERFASAQERATEALAMGRATGHRITSGQALGLLAEVARARGEWNRAFRLADEHVAALRPGGAGVQLAWALRNLAHATLETGSPARAADLYSESLRMFRDQRATLGIASTIAGIAGVAARVDAPARAARLVTAVGAILDDAGLALAPADTLALERTATASRAAAWPLASPDDAGWQPLSGLEATIAEALVLAGEIAARPDPVTPLTRIASEPD